MGKILYLSRKKKKNGSQHKEEGQFRRKYFLFNIQSHMSTVLRKKKEDSLLNKSSYSCSFEGIRKASLNIEGLREYAICIISQKKMHKDLLQFNENFIFKITMGENQKQNKIQHCLNTIVSLV